MHHLVHWAAQVACGMSTGMEDLLLQLKALGMVRGANRMLHTVPCPIMERDVVSLQETGMIHRLVAGLG